MDSSRNSHSNSAVDLVVVTPPDLARIEFSPPPPRRPASPVEWSNGDCREAAEDVVRPLGVEAMSISAAPAQTRGRETAAKISRSSRCMELVEKLVARETRAPSRVGGQADDRTRFGNSTDICLNDVPAKNPSP